MKMMMMVVVVVVVMIQEVIPVIVGATGTISKPFRTYQSIVPGTHELKQLHFAHAAAVLM
jgi:hypothetical protein